MPLPTSPSPTYEKQLPLVSEENKLLLLPREGLYRVLRPICSGHCADFVQAMICSAPAPSWVCCCLLLLRFHAFIKLSPQSIPPHSQLALCLCLSVCFPSYSPTLSPSTPLTEEPTHTSLLSSMSSGEIGPCPSSPVTLQSPRSHACSLQRPTLPQTLFELSEIFCPFSSFSTAPTPHLAPERLLLSRPCPPILTPQHPQ